MQVRHLTRHPTWNGAAMCAESSTTQASNWVAGHSKGLIIYILGGRLTSPSFLFGVGVETPRRSRKSIRSFSTRCQEVWLSTRPKMSLIVFWPHFWTTLIHFSGGSRTLKKEWAWRTSSPGSATLFLFISFSIFSVLPFDVLKMPYNSTQDISMKNCVLSTFSKCAAVLLNE